MHGKFYKAGFSAVFILLFFTDTFGKNCERMVNIFDIAVCVANPDSQLYKASVGCVNQLILNSRGSNEFFSLDFQPMRVLQSPASQVLAGPGQSAGDYLVWGELKRTETGRYSITVYLVTSKTRRLVAKGNSTFESPSEAESAGMTAALSIGFDGAKSRPVIDVITEFEKKIKKEDDRKAICPKLIFLNKNATIETEAGNKVPVIFQVKDIDDKPVREATVSVRDYEGSFDEQDKKTDQYGIVKFEHKTPSKGGDYFFRAFAKTTAPSEKELRIDDLSINVKAKKEITLLTGEIEIKASTKTGNPTISNPETSRSESQIFTVSSLDLTIIPERIKSIKKSRAVLQRALSETDRFEVVSGKTMTDQAGEPTLIRAEETYGQYDLCEGKLELSRSGKIKGYSNGFDISVCIALERGTETGNMTISSLSPRYCLLVGLGSNSRQLFQTAKYKTTGEDAGQKREYPCADLTSFSESLNPKSTLPVEGISSTIRVNDTENHEFIVPLSITNFNELEQYLLNPKGAFTITTSGSYIKRDYGEKETRVNAKLTIWPKEQESNL